MPIVDVDRLKAGGQKFASGFTNGQKVMSVLGIAALEAYLKRFGDHEKADLARRWLVLARVTRSRFAEAANAAEQYLSDAKRAGHDDAAEVRNLLGISLQRQKK